MCTAFDIIFVVDYRNILLIFEIINFNMDKIAERGSFNRILCIYDISKMFFLGLIQLADAEFDRSGWKNIVFCTSNDPFAW